MHFFFFAVHREKKVVLGESVWFYGLIRKSIIKERSEGDGGDERETLKELECFVPAQPASNTFNNETGNKTHWRTYPHMHTHITHIPANGRTCFHTLSSRLS